MENKISEKFVNPGFLHDDLKSKSVIANGRKYEIIKFEKQIIIRRKANNFVDFIWLLPYYQMIESNGEYQIFNTSSTINLKTQMNGVFKFLSGTSFILISLILTYVILNDFKIGCLIAIVLAIVYFFFFKIYKFAIVRYNENLKSDLNYF